MHSLSALTPVFRPANQPEVLSKLGANVESARAIKPATQAVLNTVELMENVFAHLTAKQLITISHVCKFFNTVIKTSPSIRPASPMAASQSKHHTDYLDLGRTTLHAR